MSPRNRISTAVPKVWLQIFGGGGEIVNPDRAHDQARLRRKIMSGNSASEIRAV
jgi:hypothetical protein